MSAKNDPPEIIVLRIHLERNRRLKLEFHAALSILFTMHDVTVSDDLLSRLTLAVSEELPGEGLGGEVVTPQEPTGASKPPQPPTPGTGGVPPQPPTPGGVPPQPPTPGGVPPQPPSPGGGGASPQPPTPRGPK
jgi:hypothetical protein